MTYVFHGTAADLVTGIIEDLAKSANGGADADAYFRRALVSLVGLHEKQALEGAVGAPKIEPRRHQLCTTLETFRNKIAAYTTLTIILAEGANEDEWYELCIRRSAIQLLRDDCPEPLAGGAIDAAEVAELDTELLRVGSEQGPVPERFRPKGLPGSHWWWRYPEPSQGS